MRSAPRGGTSCPWSPGLSFLGGQPCSHPGSLPHLPLNPLPPTGLSRQVPPPSLPLSSVWAPPDLSQAPLAAHTGCLFLETVPTSGVVRAALGDAAQPVFHGAHRLAAGCRLHPIACLFPVGQATKAFSRNTQPVCAAACGSEQPAPHRRPAPHTLRREMHTHAPASVCKNARDHGLCSGGGWSSGDKEVRPGTPESSQPGPPLENTAGRAGQVQAAWSRRFSRCVPPGARGGTPPASMGLRGEGLGVRGVIQPLYRETGCDNLRAPRHSSHRLVTNPERRPSINLSSSLTEPQPRANGPQGPRITRHVALPWSEVHAHSGIPAELGQRPCSPLVRAPLGDLWAPSRPR